ncbi:hypothetical protein GIY62_02210 [Burkholderia plantarii]|uniref:hypothetical protein n=1 Tax=Burkholderia plantarii TaxID=41899 RepID=UPI002729A1B6|nr:hypothetical protein [Burkholderia plantarii]WLE59528.1 hypothetical protein GIY62_02210 [Burkholderia plantarii]
MKKILVSLTAIILLAGCPPIKPVGNVQTASDVKELHRTLWLVAATPRVGQVVRLKINKDGTAGLVNSTNVMADAFTGYTERKPDVDRTIDLSSSTGVNVAITLLKFAGNLADSSISADADATSSAHFSFKQVLVEQPTDLQKLTDKVREIDNHTPPEARDWWANINKEAAAYSANPQQVRTFYVIDSVFNVGQIDIKTSNTRKAGLNVTCTFLTKKCAEITANNDQSASGSQAGAKPFFVILRPIKESNGTLFLDENASNAVAAVVS